MSDSRVALAFPLVLGLLASSSSAQTTELYTVSSTGTQGDAESASNSGNVVSADGRFIVFSSNATNLVPGDTNGRQDIFVRDRVAGWTRRVSVSSVGAQANQSCIVHEISADGRFVVFDTTASTLVDDDSGTGTDVFVHDLQTQTTLCVSVNPSGVPVGGANPSISADGRFVAFESAATGLVPNDMDNYRDVFVRDRLMHSTQRVSVGTGGSPAIGNSRYPSISANGRYVAFLSVANNLVPGDTNPNEDVFVHDRSSVVTERVNVASDGSQGNNYLEISFPTARPAVSWDGRFVAFYSNADNLVASDTNGVQDVFVRDRVAGTTERANVGSAGQQGSAQYGGFWMSADGRWVAFPEPSALVPNDTNMTWDIYVRDRMLGTTERASVATGGAESDDFCALPAISADGRFIVFFSHATSLVAGDVNGRGDGFVRDRGTQGFTTLCEPGIAGVVACPCSNPPSGPGRGCNNFAFYTGGAALSGSGTASLSSDGVTLSVSGENPAALTIFWTGSSQISPPGVAHGAGVRCVAALRRLYSWGAAAGFASKPQMGDPSVSARSAAVGAPITAGQVRYYFTVYRDPSAAAPCGNRSSVINVSNAVSVQWGP